MTAPRFLSFWSINAPITAPRLRTELERFAEHGLDGVVFHPRYYPGNPDYLSQDYLDIVSETILAARELGMAFWLYDENGWPSGTADGAMLRTYPHLTQQWLGLFPGPGQDPLARLERDGSAWHLAVRPGPGVDYLSAELGERFVELVYERYRQGLAPEAFDHVEAFFSDEPEFGTAHIVDELRPEAAVPWTGRLEAEFARRHGEPLRPLLPALFIERPDAADVRQAFWELASDLFADGFCAPVDRWCTEHGKRFAAHLKGEESVLFQVFTSGCAEAAFRRMSLPGVDALERRPGNDYYPRQASTAARQFGDGRTMAEAFGGAGWGAGPADLEAYVTWLTGHGITDIVFHISQLRLDSPALFDWPPSQPLHLTWAPAYATLLDRLRAGATPRPPADTLIVSPHRRVMQTVQPWELPHTNIHNASTHPDTVAGRVSDRFGALVEAAHRQGVAYDVVSERTLEEHGEIGSGRVRIGAQAYRAVLVSPDAALDSGVRDALDRSGTLRDPGDLDACPASDTPGPVPVPGDPVFTTRPRWAVPASPINELPLTVAPEDGWCSAILRSTLREPVGVELVFADDVTDLTVDGETVAAPAGPDGSRAAVLLPEGDAETALRFHVPHAAPLAFAWVRGSFGVRSESPYTPAEQDDQVVTDGPFEIVDARPVAGEPDLLAGGYPFSRLPVQAGTVVTLPAPARRLEVAGHHADAVRISVDGTTGPWRWGERVGLDIELSAGEHAVEVTVIPNSYNVYGPHHYLRGDATAISPGQIQGTHNVLDPDLPPATHEARWHLRRFGLPTVVDAFG